MADEDLKNLPVKECDGARRVRESVSAVFLALLLRVCKVREEQWEIKEEAQEPWAISLFSTKKPLWWGGKICPNLNHNGIHLQSCRSRPGQPPLALDTEGLSIARLGK